MPFDANGNFSLVPGTIVADGLNILPSQHNPPFQDVANGLSQAVVRDGRAPMTGPLNMNGYKITGVAAGDAPDDVVTNAAIADLGVAIGDGKWSLRDLSPNWLRRDGKLYLRADYPALAELMPPLPDGVSWTARPSGASGALTAITAGAGKFIAVGNANIVSSDDGLSWSLDATFSGALFYDVAYGNGVFLAAEIADGKVFTSPDGKLWSQTTTLPNYVTTVAYFPDQALFFAGGQAGYIIASDDAINWTNKASGTTRNISKIRLLNERLVAVCSGGTILHSTDGNTWSVVTVPGFSGGFNDVAFKDGTYVAVGINGAIYTSTNLATWTPRTSGVSTNLNGVVAGATGFMVVGSNGVARISTDGTSWTPAPIGVTATLNSAVVDPDDGNRYLVVGVGTNLFDGIRTLPTQFRVPNDDPTYGWIRAL